MPVLIIAVLLLMMLVNIASMAASRGGFSRDRNLAFYAGALGTLSIPVAVVTPLGGAIVWVLVGFPDMVTNIVYIAAACALLSTFTSAVMIIRLGLRRKAVPSS